MWNPDGFMEMLYEQSVTARKGLSSRSNSERKALLKERLQSSLGSYEDMRAPLNPILLERIEYEDYIRERIEIGTVIGLRMPIYILIPKTEVRVVQSGQLPGMLALHGHGYGSREVIGLASDGTMLTKKGGHNSFAMELMRQGHIVVAPEMIGLGDRRLLRDTIPGKERSSCISLTGQLLMYGMSLGGLRVFEALRALDYFVTRTEVAADQIGCMGFSGGGTVAAYASALDERIKATVLCAFTNTFKGSILSINHCIDNFVPGVLDYAELPDLIGLIAPRPLFIESGENDPIFPASSLQEAIEILQGIYCQEQAEDMLQYDIFPGVHEVNGREIYPWLRSIWRSGISHYPGNDLNMIEEAKAE
ncbi:alpha/beta hydrolase family protein [Paenibacillus sp. FSL R10-2734]|uniref:dienelactone hydrolase family protein n=1 Tax=Paenibacillus sp. FSL R10-2734 TaxID=2954691 RepID=UPI0030D7B751